MTLVPKARQASTAPQSRQASIAPQPRQASTAPKARQTSTTPNTRQTSTTQQAHQGKTAPHGRQASTVPKAHRISSGNGASGDLLTGAAALTGCGLVREPAVPASQARFPDGADFRIEIPSVEGPQVLRAVVAEAAARGVTVNRVSQGSGAMLLTQAEIGEMARIGADNGMEVSLFVGPREEWGLSRMAAAADGLMLAGKLRGTRQLSYAIDDIARAAEQGIRGFLIADPGLLHLVSKLQQAGQLPVSMVWKVSAMLAPSNPLSFRLLESLGGSTINVPSDLTLGQIAEMRAVSTLPIDLYVESPDNIGGIMRGHEAAELIRAGSPMYLKFGLRNSRPLYPCGAHLIGDAMAIAREKVHRAAVSLEWIERSKLEITQSQPGAKGLGVPELPR